MNFRKNSIILFFFLVVFEFGSWFINLDPANLTAFFLVNKLLKYWHISKNLIYELFRYGIPNIIFLAISYNFFLYIRKKILQLKELKMQMAKQTKNQTLEIYQNKLSIMKSTLLLILGFLFISGVIGFCFFAESLLMENILFFNIALIMTTLLEINSNENQIRLGKNAIFLINFTMIFLSTFLINDLFYWITGIKVFP